MSDDFLKWALGVIASTGLISGIVFLMRDTVAKFFTKAVEHRFERKIETFKADIRDNEKELEQIRSFLVSSKRDRDSAIQAKRLEAAEILLRARDSLSQLSILVEYMKILEIDNILSDSGNPKITEFIETLMKPLDVDNKLNQIGSIDRTIPRLYLSEKSLNAFDTYQSIIISAAMMMKLFCIQLRDKNKIVKTGHLSKAVIEMVPESKEGFDKWGESYAYHWSAYFHDETLKALRNEVSGISDMARDTESIQRLALDSRRAQVNIRLSLEQSGLPGNLIKPDEGISAV